MSVTAEHIRIITAALDKNGVTTRTLRDDLIDHLCCDIDNKMNSGKDFHQALAEGIEELAPEGLVAIQRETQLLTLTNIPMRKLMYIVGLVTSIMMSMGVMMKLLHMKGGEQLTNTGFLGFILLFLPLYAVIRWRSGALVSALDKGQFLSAAASAVAIALAVIFKIGEALVPSEVLFIWGVSLFSFVFLPLVFFKNYRKSITVH